MPEPDTLDGMGSALRMIEKVGEHGGRNVAKGVIGYGTARMLARHCHGKKDSGRIPFGIAALGKGIPALVALFFGEVDGVAGMAMGAADAAGQGALDFLGVVHGLRDARQQKGLRAIAVPASADVRALPAGSMVDAPLVGEEVATLGGLGMAQPGASMNLDKLRELQSYR